MVKKAAAPAKPVARKRAAAPAARKAAPVAAVSKADRLVETAARNTLALATTSDYNLMHGESAPPLPVVGARVRATIGAVAGGVAGNIKGGRQQ